MFSQCHSRSKENTLKFNWIFFDMSLFERWIIYRPIYKRSLPLIFQLKTYQNNFVSISFFMTYQLKASRKINKQVPQLTYVHTGYKVNIN